MATTESSLVTHPSGTHVETALPDGTLVVTDDSGAVQSAIREGQPVTLTKTLRQTLVEAGYRDATEQTTAPEVTAASPDADASTKGALSSPAPIPSSRETKPKARI